MLKGFNRFKFVLYTQHGNGSNCHAEVIFFLPLKISGLWLYYA